MLSITNEVDPFNFRLRTFIFPSCNLCLKVFHGQLRGVLKKIKGCWKIWQTKHFLFNNINSKKLAMTKINR